MERDLCKEESSVSYRQPKLGGFFSAVDYMTTEELSVGSGTPGVDKGSLDKKKNTKDVNHWSLRKEATIVPRRSPRKAMKLQVQTQEKAVLMKELFDDSSLSVASQDDNEEEEAETESHVKRARSDSSEDSVKKSKQESPVKEPTFQFFEEDNISAQMSISKKAPVKSKAIEENNGPVVNRNMSSVFEIEDYSFFEIQTKNDKEAEKLAARTKDKSKGRKRESMARMAEFSQSLTGSLSLNECSQLSSSSECGTKFKIPKLKKLRKKKGNDLSQKMFDSFFKQDVVPSMEKESNNELEEARDYTPSIDELLKLPDRPEDGGKTMDEVLDDLDKEIAERKKQHEEEMAMIDADIAAEKQRQEERRERMKTNAVLRNRLEVEITESVLRRMFEENIEYLRDIEAGRVESSRHQAFHKSSRTRHALYYTMITDPFTDDQLDWTLEEMGKVWMKTKREQMDNNEYVWKVLLAECLIKFYMDFFSFDKKETEKRINETPLRKADDSEENSSDDDL